MSKSRVTIDEGNNTVFTSHHREVHTEPSGHYISSVVINLRQLQTDLRAQHQHDKQALNELNKGFQHFVDRVQQLQAQNSRYQIAIADLRRQYSGVSIDTKWDEGYFALRRDLSAINNARIDYEWDFELCQLQIAIYKQLIGIEQQWEGKRTSMLEDELKQSSSVLHGLRTSYAEMHRKVESLYGECDDLFKQYLTATHDWCIVKKQRDKGRLHMDSLKGYIAFYKNLRSYVGHDSGSVSLGDIQVRTLDLDNIKKKIRYDFEAFYATIYREMAASYEAKMTELEADVKEALQNQSAENEEFAMRIQIQQTEYEKAQKSLAYEREALTKLEHTYSKLEAEYKSIQLQYEERFAAQARDLQNAQENIMFLAFDVDEIRRSKADLEAEIIVYRHLLEVYEVEHRPTVVHPTPQVPQIPQVSQIQTTGSEMMGKLVVRSQKKGPVGINECTPNGAYISLVNYSTSKDVDISRWRLKRQIDSVTKLRYTIPDGVRLKRDSELRIYTKSSGGPSTDSSSYQKLVNNDLTSWGMGTSIETILFNKNGDEEASYSQMIKFQ